MHKKATLNGRFLVWLVKYEDSLEESLELVSQSINQLKSRYFFTIYYDCLIKHR